MAQEKKITLAIQGMHCAGCVATIEKGVKRLPKIEDIRVNLATASAFIAYDNKKTEKQAIIGTIEGLGYKASDAGKDLLASLKQEAQIVERRFAIALVFALPVIILAMLPMVSELHLIPAPWNGLVQLLCTAVVLFVAGSGILADAWKQTKHLTANMNSLITLGSLAAFGWSIYQFTLDFMHGTAGHYYFESAAAIVTLILLGRLIESRTKQGAGNAIQNLIALRPPQATAVINGVEVLVDSASLQPGMNVIVKAGERIPADGEIIEGRTAIDESMVTGESFPVEKKIGDPVIGGSVNGNFAFTLKVTKAASESFLSHVVWLVSEAQTGRTEIQRLADRVAAVFVPVVLGIALLTAAIWYFTAPDDPHFISSVIAVLIIACPCALGLATPTAILAGTSRAAREGIIYRGGEVLERLTAIDSLVFDKTGTLTCGEFEVKELHTFNNVDEATLLRLAASVEKRSEHHLGQAVLAAAEKRDVTLSDVQAVETKPGRGIAAKVEGSLIRIGNRAFLEEANISVADAREECAEDMEKARTVIYVARDQKLIGVISFADRVRTESAEVVGWFKQRMQRVMLVSGDSYRTVQGVADAIGIDHIAYEINPEGKKVIVDTLERSGMRVAMVGDGINDAPALAAATVGIAVGAGTDIAKETADVILAGSDLRQARRAFELAALTVRKIKQNLFWAFAYNVIAIPIAAGLFYPLWGWTFSPIIAAAAMAFSSLFVVLNSASLARTSH